MRIAITYIVTMLRNVTVKEISTENRPRERLLIKGANALSDAELLAIILRSGGKSKTAIEISFQLLKDHGSIRKILEADIRQITEQQYVGVVKAITFKAVEEIAKRAYLTGQKEGLMVKTPSDAFKLIKKDLYGKKQERLFLICLDTRKKYISKELISIGSVNETLIPVREIVQKALINDSVNIIIAHNHPSNDPAPSKEDILVTEKVAKACEVVGISLLDHIVTADNRYISIKSMDIFDSN